MKTLKCILLLMTLNLGTVASAQLNESLSPLIINTHNRKTVSLNGQWQIIIDPFENGYYNHRYLPKKDGYFLNRKASDKTELVEYNFDTAETLNVPGDWNTQKEKLFLYEGTIWYKKDFEYKKNDNRLFLYFGAVNYEAHVYLNGEKVGKHTGGFTPFNIEITNKVKSGNNFVVLKVDNKRKKEAVPTVNTDWWNYGGITRDVKLVEVPKTYIQNYKVILNQEGNDSIEGTVVLDGEIKNTNVTVKIPELSLSKTVKAKNGQAHFSLKAVPQKWSPQNPKLYHISFVTETDSVSDQIGFRTIETKGENILLNGKSIFLKGISIHEEAPFRSGRAYSEEDAKILLGWAKDLGCNFVRLAHYTHNEHMLREADRLGLMVWSEIPVYWTVQWENKETLQNAVNQLSESINRDCNRASVIIWSVANETPPGKSRLAFLKTLIEKAREMDSTRLISAATDTHDSSSDSNLHILSDELADYLDVIGVNFYCGWYSGLPESCGDLVWRSEYGKPMIMSEFGGGALYGNHADKLTRWSEEYQESLYENNLQMLSNISFLRGFTPWILIDFYSSRRPLPNIQDNYNRKGLISEKGQKKAAFYTLQKYYKSLKK